MGNGNNIRKFIYNTFINKEYAKIAESFDDFNLEDHLVLINHELSRNPDRAYRCVVKKIGTKYFKDGEAKLPLTVYVPDEGNVYLIDAINFSYEPKITRLRNDGRFQVYPRRVIGEEDLDKERAVILNDRGKIEFDMLASCGGVRPRKLTASLDVFDDDLDIDEDGFKKQKDYLVIGRNYLG